MIPASEVLAIGSLLLLAAGYRFSSGPHRMAGRRLPAAVGHRLCMVGWLALGGFWWSEVEHYILIRDPVNALFCAMALPFFGYLAYHHWLTIEWRREYPALRWLVAMTVIAGGIYFLVERVPFLAGWLIQVVAEQSVWLLNVAGAPTTLGPLDYGEGSRWYRLGSAHQEVSVPVEAAWRDPMSPAVSIVLACTALQSMIIFVGGVLCTSAPRQRRVYAFLATVPTIYLLNLIRNAVVIWLTYEHVWGDDTFYYAHAWIGKGGSLVALVALAYIVFHYLPEMQDAILGVMDLPWREPPAGMRTPPFAAGTPGWITIAFVAGLVLAPFGAAAGTPSELPLDAVAWAAAALLALGAGLLWFHRDPPRPVGDGVVSPADGTVLSVDERDDHVRLSIFMSPFNVHVNRAPIAGRVTVQQRSGAGFSPAYSAAADGNLQVRTELETAVGPVAVTQVAGALARRITSYLSEGQQLAKGERIGIIHLGSRVDLELPLGAEMVVQPGQKLWAGQTVARLTGS
jgi:phosphatidylserine decarboxylase